MSSKEEYLRELQKGIEARKKLLADRQKDRDEAFAILIEMWHSIVDKVQILFYFQKIRN